MKNTRFCMRIMIWKKKRFSEQANGLKGVKTMIIHHLLKHHKAITFFFLAITQGLVFPSASDRSYFWWLWNEQPNSFVSARQITKASTPKGQLVCQVITNRQSVIINSCTHKRQSNIRVAQMKSELLLRSILELKFCNLA